MKSIIRAVILLTLVLFGCNNENNPVESSDQLIERAIIGKWSKSGYSITFNSDNTFTDSTLYTTMLDSSKSKIDTIKMSGKYYIQNGVLYYTNVEFTYLGTMLGIHYRTSANEISIVDNKLSMTLIDILNSSSNSNSIIGNWKRDGWYCGFFKQDSIIKYKGQFEESYSFYSDSVKCNYRFKYISGYYSPNDYTYSLEYSYQQPLMSIPALGENNMNVKFQDNKMIWYLNAPVSILTKAL